MDKGAESYRKYLDGDNNGLAEIISDYKDGLTLYLNSITKDIHTAEELTEDTFVRIGIKKPKFKASKASFKTWIYTIASNMAIDHLRQKARKRVLSVEACADIPSGESPEALFARYECRMAVRKALDRLNTQYRQVLWLIYFENFSIKETAEIMKKSQHSVETTAYRARQSLKKELEKEGFEYEDLQ